ncbi:unnamed protein product [Brassicogethes aeneus]|uniref:Multidrug resistance-associated protein lethal(2)03659 n=1 Tax=Brassicogethes aeneus TaxID=1431903 RepID=A0A9P0B6U8_BRAAE|nr:unnamed protein product [Brassicogethes aeneus]
MDYDYRKTRPKNPRKNASILSIITFKYVFGLLNKGYKKDLKNDDIYEILPDFQSKKLGDELEKNWEIEKKKTKKPSLYSIIWSTYGKKYLLLGALNVIVQIGFVLLKPKALGKFVSNFASIESFNKEEAFYYGSLLIGITFFKYFFDNNYHQILQEFSIRVCTSFSSLLYRKSLKLSPIALSEITMGKIVTLMTKDIFSFESAIGCFNEMWNGLVLLIIVTYMIYSRIGVSAFFGIGFILLCVPFQLYLGKKCSDFRIKCSTKTDDRIQVTQEALTAIKIIKMYTWEYFFEKHVNDARKKEMIALTKIYHLKVLSLSLGTLLTSISFCLMIVANNWLGNEMTAEDVYYVITCFGMIRMFITIYIPLGISQTAELKASLHRLDAVMNAEELERNNIKNNKANIGKIYMDNLGFTIGNQVILEDVSMSAETGLIIITGNVGSGKSTLLKIILGEYPATKGILNIQGSISYAGQDPWLFPSTIKQNILFGSDFNEDRYNKVIAVCALTHDFNLLEKGDQTIVGDKGINLSKGQKARISLARACYKNSNIYLLDDCLTALDAKVNMYVFQKCLKEFLSGKLIVFVSHNDFHLKHADYILTLNGQSTFEASKNRLSRRITNYIDDAKANLLVDPINELIDGNEEDSLLEKVTENKQDLYEETKKEGKVSLTVYKKYLSYYGGCWALLLVFSLFISAQFIVNYAEKLLSNWVNLQTKISLLRNNSTMNSTDIEESMFEHNTTFYWYIMLTLSIVVLTFTRSVFHFYFSLKSSLKLHDSMVGCLMNTYMSFFDLHFIGNIINRFSRDLSAIDEYLPYLFYEVLRIILLMFGIVLLIATVNPLFLISAGIFGCLIFFLKSYYIPTARSLRRLNASTRSPLIGYLNASLDGLSTIRSYGTEDILRREFDRHQDLFFSNSFMSVMSQRGFGFSIDMFSTIFISTLIMGFIYFGKNDSAGNVGMAVTQGFMLTSLLTWSIRQFSELEAQSTSIERVLEYTDIKRECKKYGRTIPNWPSVGKIEFINVNLLYETTQKHILKDINFTIESKQKIGIVGRTGAGKSSIISTLFRLYEVTGGIRIDNIDIKQLNLDFLRSSIAIIPQDPILFSGTIRVNIDPLKKFTDDEIWKAIRIVELTKFIPSLDFYITENGSKYSAGQKQMICLARALVTKNRIIVLDEATANMDPDTDKLLHDTIKKYFSDSTVLTIAHRLNSVIKSDKVLVVDDGQIVEFDDPKVLLKNEHGYFYKMAIQAGVIMKS